MIKSLVINPPFIEPHRPPITSAILGEILRLQGHDVTVQDINIEVYHALGPDEFHAVQVKHTTDSDPSGMAKIMNLVEIELEKIKSIESFDWILISCFSFWNNLVTGEIVKWLRTKTSAKIVVGGAGVETQGYGKFLYDNGHVDYYIHGEGEHTLVELVNGNTTYPGINGIPPKQIDDIENLPLPNYGFFNLDRYVKLLDAPDVFIYGSRGCVRKCTFCDVETFWPKFRWRSGQSIANEMISNYEKYGIRNFYFSDSLCNGNLKEFRIMCEILAKYKEGFFHWGSFMIVRPKSSHPASLFDLIGAAGGKHVSIGIETGVDRIRAEMDKKFTNNDIDWHLENSQRIGLQNMFLQIPTWPSETLAEHEEYLSMFSRWRPYAVDGTIYGVRISPTLSVLENTRLAARQGIDFDLEKFNGHDVPMQVVLTSWKVPANPDLTHKEKFRRTLAIYEAAIENNWPLVNRLQNLNELRSLVKNWGEQSSKYIVRKVIPIIDGVKS